MKRRIFSSLSYKMLLCLLLADILSLAALLTVTFCVTKPRLEQETLQAAVRTGQQLADEMDLILDQFGMGAMYVAADDGLRQAIEQMEAGGADRISEVLTANCTESLLDMRATALLGGEKLWLSDHAFDAAELGFLYSPTMYAMPADSHGPGFSSIYISTERVQSLNACARLYSVSGETYYVVCIYNAEDLMQTVHETLEYGYNGFHLAQVDGPSFYSGGMAGNAAAILSQHTEAGNYVLEDEAGYYIVTQTDYSWRIGGFISRETFAAGYMPSIRLAITLCLLMLVLSLLALQPFLQSILRPVRRLRQDMEAAAGGDLQVRAQTKSRDELGELGQYFNHMLDQIRSHLDERLRLERQEQNMRHQLLLSQVNYHFIFHAMSSINTLARRQDYENIITVNTALSRMLQSNMLPQNGQMTGALENELSNVQNYWTIQRIGRSGEAELVLDCPPELLQSRVPCNLLQPLVENSLRHGLSDEETGALSGWVRIRAWAEDAQLHLEVADNGRGIAPEMLERLNAPDEEALQSGRHIGLANVRQRLRFLYGEQGSMQVESNGGTTIHIDIPLD